MQQVETTQVNNLKQTNQSSKVKITIKTKYIKQTQNNPNQNNQTITNCKSTIKQTQHLTTNNQAIYNNKINHKNPSIQNQT